MNEITLLIADDHPLFRQGVVGTLSLEKDFQIIAQAADGDEAIELIRSLKPRVAVLDVNMPGLNGQQVPVLLLYLAHAPIERAFRAFVENKGETTRRGV